ncbi:nucleoid-associated protein (plasmid) [Clostridium estertheticum]|uniref:nucleoid-associated protein n=1 Tax=Clostridium estertheticum TaxID=238834 RepID=UPI001C7D04FD|nr:nucleoid-associated protein [Clostridium estertheticum]MBX4259779.1 nucleoid-associated protein [Clostridium estertheticum]WLC73271.1 nucleoid-associated protein [Clostridium estertheticum]
MEYIKEININEAVIHVLDNNSDVPILNEYALDLNEDMYNILLKLIKKGLNDEKLRYAVFNDCTGLVMDQTKKYLNGENNLLYISKEIAKELFSLMRSKGGIPSCDFITVSFTTEFGPLLGLFKMDYIKNYTHSIEIIDNKMSIDVIAQMSSLSDKAQKIQKCAFIKAFREENTFDLMVIDNQSKNKVDEEYGSTYFTGDFLKCDLVSNERDMTRNFMAATERYARTNFREDAEKQEIFRKDVKRQLEENESINIHDFAEKIFDDDEMENFNEFMEENNVVGIITVDKEYIAKKLRRTRLKIEGGIDIYVNEDTYNDKSQFDVQRNGDGTINMIIKHISNYIEK